VILVDRDRAALQERPAGRPSLACAGAGARDLAYVIYTSGSTGEPKGVMLAHRGLVNHNFAVARLYGLGPGDRVVQFCSIGFDVSVEEIFPTWASGATLVLRPAEVPILGRPWVDWLERTRITVLNLPTAYWHEWTRDLERLGARVPDRVRLVIAGGEKALGSAYAAWRRAAGDRVRWINAYGPAETSVLATAYEPDARALVSADRDPPIGRPLANTTLEILDAGQAGAPGELLIGGVGVARGYLGRPELTAERFVGEGDDRRYRTGDLVRVGADGELEFVGREDEQVKVRGFRIEPGEIESALTRHAAVAEAAVVAREDAPGDKRLVAYVVGAGGAGGAAVPDPAELRRFLSERLPAYMVPSAFVSLEALPFTANGKVARDALPAPVRPAREPGAAPDAVPDAAGTPAERAIAAIVARVLGRDGVGPGEDFFALGGHSLQAMQVLAAVHQELGAEIGVGTLYDEPTVAALAAAVEAARARGARAGGARAGGARAGGARAGGARAGGARAGGARAGGARAGGGEPPPLRRRARHPEEPIPLTLSQGHMWRLETTADPPGLFNVTAQHRFDGPVDAEALRRALAYVVDRHEALRASFRSGEDGPYQVIAPTLDVELAEGAVGEGPALREALAGQDAAPFDLESGPLLRTCLYRGGGDGDGRDGDMVAATFDHLVCDGTSAYIFLSELAAAYEALAAGAAPSLRPLGVQYPDYALWQREWLTEERLERQLAYWREKLAGLPWGPAVPFDRVPERPSRRIQAIEFETTTETYRGIERVARATRSTVFIVTVAAFQALFSSVSGATDIVLSTTLSGRRRAEVDGLIGCFHGVGRIRTELAGTETFAEVIARTRETVIGLVEHQDLPFWRIRRALLADFPSGGPALLAAVPTELQYFHTAHDEWAPGAGVVERPGLERGPDELFFRGHLQPLQVQVLDDGSRLWGQFSYKTDFYDAETIERLVAGLGELLEAEGSLTPG
jgi:amino acid adenylation domain-containing protein